MTNITEEIWKDIPEFTGYYQASNLGRIRRNGRILKQGLSKNPLNQYKHLTICVAGKKLNRTVHTLVAKAWIDNPHNKSSVNHKDGDKHNNQIDNLEWVTRSENTVHAIKSGLIKGRRPDSLIDSDKASKIRKMIDSGIDQMSVALHFNTNQSTISRVVNGKRHYWRL